MIDVIIPAYNAHETIDRTLFSIAYQDIVDNINVYIVNDCSNNDYSDLVNFFSNFMKISEIKLEKNGGPGVARQKGIDHSKGKYIIFIDADDNFSDSFAIRRLFECIDNNDYDVVISDFVEELNNQFIEHNNDPVWVHGKIYRRKFLDDNNIAFNATRSNEDNGFNQLITFMNGKIFYLNSKTYIWRNNLKSITRRNNREYSVTGLEGYSYNMLWAMKKAIENNGNLTAISELAYLVSVSAYYYYLKYKDLDVLHNFLINVKEIIKYIDVCPLDNNKKMELYKIQQNYALNNLLNDEINMVIPDISYSQFLDIVQNLEGECSI